jgi:hypothetical protein
MSLPEEGIVLCPFCGEWIEVVHTEDAAALPPIAGFAVKRPVYMHPPPFCQAFEDISADDFTALLTKDSAS